MVTEWLKPNLHLSLRGDLRPCLCRPNEVNVWSLSICVIWVWRSWQKHTSKQPSYISWCSAYLSVFLLFSPFFPAPQTPPCLSQLARGSIPAKPLRVWSEGRGSFRLNAFTPLWGFSFQKECVRFYTHLGTLFSNSPSRKEKAVMWGRFKQSRIKQCTG